MEDDEFMTKQDHGVKRKTPLQIQSLERFYSEEKYPKPKAIEDYAASLNLTYKQVSKWFSDKRRKERKENDLCRVSNDGSGNILKERSSLLEEVQSGPDRSNCDQMWTAEANLMNESGSGTEGSGNNSAMRSSLGQGGPETQVHVGILNLDQSNRGSSQEVPISMIEKGSLYQRRMQPKRIHKKTQESSESMDGHRLFHSHNGFVGQGFRQGPSRIWKKKLVRLQILVSPEYILKKVFRKDGPPLGVEFETLPDGAFGRSNDSIYLLRRDDQREPKSRKISKSPLDLRNLQSNSAPMRKYGIGKGLMTVWRATNSENESLPPQVNFLNKRLTNISPNSVLSISKESSCQMLKRSQPRRFAQKKRPLVNKVQDKRKSSMKKRKVVNSKDGNEKVYRTDCKLALDGHMSLEYLNTTTELVDDEELELSELQAGRNPLRCSVHLATNGKHGCSLCKDLLARFPPSSVKMKLPLCTKPWDTSPDVVKKLFKIFRFLYTHAVAIGICPFTLDEFAQAFHDKDSLLLGKIHLALLKLLLSDVEMEIDTGVLPRAMKDCRFLRFLHTVRLQVFCVKIWSKCLNPLTWIEILRQVLIAAGFGSNQDSLRRGMLNKEGNLMAKYGLRSRTLKGELFSILSEHGSKGLQVSELAKFPQIVELDLPNTKDELEDLICSTLSSDITLFEKISSFAYRLRVNPLMKKGMGVSQSDTDDSGSVDDDFEGASTSSNSSDDSDGSDLDSSMCEQAIVRYKSPHKRKRNKLVEYTEIDESYPGEAWVVGLMEGEYSNLSTEEKLSALAALVDLAGSGSSLRKEDPARSLSTNMPNIQQQRSGAKIKKASANSSTLPPSYWGHMQSSTGTGNAERTVEMPSGVHPLQSIFLGSDRRYNSYWLFLGPCIVNEPGHRRVYFESSEDGHWEVIDTEEALCSLLSVLDGRGAREAQLLASLTKREALLSQVMSENRKNESETGIRQAKSSDPSDMDVNNGNGSSPISDLDNNLNLSEGTSDGSASSGAILLELGKNYEEKKQKWDRLQEFDTWIWNSFYNNLNAVRFSKVPYLDSLTRCRSCHDLYWRDEKHCKICHTTFELDFDLEEKYVVHVATCREIEGTSMFPSHKVLPSQLQALKAAIHAIESVLPEEACGRTWTSSARKLWGKRLRRTSSVPELLQVLTDLVGAISEEWLSQCGFSLGSNTFLDEILVFFQTMPQTTSAFALWMVKLDTVIGPYLERLQSEKSLKCKPQVKRKRVVS
ncbi:hypothetical protein QJS04_geneDACA005525 [Acorus gramineus]|uniref:Homeobox-DDT domain protein RLT3 n=1 Tax=Acorus gramineus TaxID=55184 RepID=A0AAV9A4G1_ACOGR|nr:hypothetical protein QJS04_geneDACA005525 [Acorus gramineus]